MIEKVSLECESYFLDDLVVQNFVNFLLLMLWKEFLVDYGGIVLYNLL